MGLGEDFIDGFADVSTYRRTEGLVVGQAGGEFFNGLVDGAYSMFHRVLIVEL